MNATVTLPRLWNPAEHQAAGMVPLGTYTQPTRIGAPVAVVARPRPETAA